MITVSRTWDESNRKYLVSSIDQIKILLEGHKAKMNGGRVGGGEEVGTTAQVLQISPQPEWTEESPPAIGIVCGLFGLSLFEKSVLLLCAGVELNSEISKLCAEIHGNPNSTYPTFGLALAALPQPHWNALTPASPLRKFKLIDIYDGSSNLTPVTNSPLRIQERVLHYLTGISYLEKELQGMLKPVRQNAPIVKSHKDIVEKILASCKNTKGTTLPLIQLWGTDGTSKLVIARRACANLGLDLWCLTSELVPSKTEEMQLFIQEWTREAALLGSGLYISAEDVVVETATQKSIARLIDNIPGPVFLGTVERWPVSDRFTVILEVRKPVKAEQYQIWNFCLGERSKKLDNHGISKLVGQFDLNSSTIRKAVSQALLSAKGDDYLFSDLWESSCAITRPRMTDLAQLIIPKAKMDDLVLPPPLKQMLREIAIQVVQRDKVYREWGFERTENRGLGITALFSGATGTGKTMAAEALASELHLDLFRVDLSALVSKYIGETEKNLRRVFDAAEDGGAILFFDEADALFGKRSEVKDSHDRYANIEVGYLLQRMEIYRGVAILATNMRDSLDTAFMRRIRFSLNFPFPDEKSRAEIWRRVFPSTTPTDGLDIRNLAKLNISGGNIHNIALNASFLAAEEGGAVNMEHLKRAAQVEYEKLERPLTQDELVGWS